MSRRQITDGVIHTRAFSAIMRGSARFPRLPE